MTRKVHKPKAMSGYLSTLTLSNFRSYDRVRLDNLGSGLIVLHGPNGAGKTNVLEAVSLLAPGRGMRGAKNEDIQKSGVQDGWGVSGVAQQEFGEVRLGTGLDMTSGKRAIRIDGQTVRGQNALADYMACVWLTPQMDRLFLDSTSQRRKFFDRLVYAFDPAHAGRVTRYENALGQRSRILRESAEKQVTPDDSWLSSLESQMAASACAIAAARQSFIKRLQAVCSESSDGSKGESLRARTYANPFPSARLQLRGTLEELLGHTAALDVEDMFKAQLRQSRPRDAIVGGAQTGPHKTDLLVSYAAKNMPAEQCSTGEQKALLIGIILAHAKLIAAERGAPPILLLDEVAAHLDEDRRAALYDLLQQLGGQVWLTGTDENLFTAIADKAQFFTVNEGKLQVKAQSCVTA